MAVKEFKRSLPRRHQVVGWVAILSLPLVTVVVFWGTLAAIETHVAWIRLLAQELPVGKRGVVGGLAILVVLGWFGPLGVVVAYRRWLHQRYGECRIEGDFAAFRMPFSATYHVPLLKLERREPTRFGLQVKHPQGGWLLIPCEGEQAAGDVAKTLDDLASEALEPAEVRGTEELPAGTRIWIEQQGAGELVLSWPLIRAEKVRFTWLLALGLLPVCGAGLLLVPGLLLRKRRRNRLRLTPERLRLRSGVPFTGFQRDLVRDAIDAVECTDLMLWIKTKGRRQYLLDALALPLRDVRWLYALVQAWHAGRLQLTAPEDPAA